MWVTVGLVVEAIAAEARGREIRWARRWIQFLIDRKLTNDLDFPKDFGSYL
jgi:hypothetical protein